MIQRKSLVKAEYPFSSPFLFSQPLQQSGKDHTILKVLPPGIYQYKFIVDDQWRYAPDLPAVYDEMGNVNNVLEVQVFS